jgi:hypothetical protein
MNREKRRKKGTLIVLLPVGTDKTETPGEKRTRGEGRTYFPKDLCVNTENYKGLSVKQNFPLI